MPERRSLTQRALADLADIPATSRWVRSGGLALHVLDYGGEEPPAVMLPGITSPAVTMDFVARRLTDLVRPVLLDVRGRGLSDSAPDASGYRLDPYADDVEAVVHALGLDHPVLIGHSMGARIAAVVAARRRLPIRGCLLVDPPMSGPGRGPYPTALNVFLDQLAQADRGTDADEVARYWPRWPHSEQALRARWLGSCSAEAISATHAGFESDDFFDTWPMVPAPVTLVHGGDSPVVTPAGAREAAVTNPAARLVEVPGTGHMVFWDDPGGALAATRSALSTML